MSIKKTFAESKLRRVFPSAPPKEITQPAFDSGPKHLSRLAKLRPGDQAESRDLWEYTQDILYSGEIQGLLLTYLLPFCLLAWRDDLRGTHTGYGGFVEYFYPMLANKGVFKEFLTPTQTTAVSEFMRESILEEINDQRGLTYKGMGARPYRWIRALTTHGVLLPDVHQLWTTWWSMDTVGRAIATVQYVSCLIYPKDENPVFAAWTPDGGGGPPCLWEFAGHLYEHRWIEANIHFLRRNLDSERVRDALNRAVQWLDGEPEYDIALEVQEDLPLCAETLASRCVELANLLETTPRPHEWSR
jgi:hypothetical protein